MRVFSNTEFRYIYVIGTPSGPYKIGIATSLDERLKGLQTGSHVEYSVHHATKVPYRLAARIERRVHKRLGDFRLFGEWFTVSIGSAKAEIAQVIDTIKAEDKAQKLAQAIAEQKRAEAEQRYLA